jgi:hypothetical protein
MPRQGLSVVSPAFEAEALASLDSLYRAALRLTRSARYGGAGTIEFIVDAETFEFFFLEMNTAKIFLFVQFHSDQFAPRNDLQHVRANIGISYDDLQEFMGSHLLDQLAHSQQRKRSDAFPEIYDVVWFLFHFRSGPSVRVRRS